MIPGRVEPGRILALVLLLGFPLHHAQPHHALQLHAQPSYNVGCVFSSQVCERDEECFDDGVLGRCISPHTQNAEALFRTGPITSSELHLLAAQMKRLLDQGYTWEMEYAQCVLQAAVDHVTYRTAYTPAECDHLQTLDTDQPDLDQVDDDNTEDGNEDETEREDDPYLTTIYKDSSVDAPYPEIIPVEIDPDEPAAYASSLTDDELPTILTFDNTDVMEPANQQGYEWDEDNDAIEDDNNNVWHDLYTVHYVPDSRDTPLQRKVPAAELRHGRYQVYGDAYVDDFNLGEEMDAEDGEVEEGEDDEFRLLPVLEDIDQRGGEVGGDSADRIKRRTPEWIIYQEPEEQEENTRPSYDFDYTESTEDSGEDADTVYYSTEARYPLETVFDRRERLDVKKPGPFYTNSQNNFFIDKLLRGDYNRAALTESSPNGQTEYEFPLITNTKHKKSSWNGEKAEWKGLSYEGVDDNEDNFLIIYVKDRLSTLNQADVVLQAVADQLQLPRQTFTNLKLWPNRVRVSMNDNPRQLNASAASQALGNEIESVNARIPESYNIKVDSIAYGTQTDVTSVFTGQSRLFLALFLLTAGISSGILVAGLLLILRKRRNKKIEKQMEKEVKSEPVKEYKQLVRDWSRSSRASQSSNPGASASPSAGAGAKPSKGSVGGEEKEKGGEEGKGGVEEGRKQPPTLVTAKSHNSEGSRTSSTSSWHEDPGVTTMDISTGHMVLNYMEDHLNNKQRLEQEWVGLCAYEAEPSATTVAFKVENRKKNRYPDKLPYDHNRVLLNALANADNSDYINASTVTDHDPRNPGYIVSQGPLQHTVPDFWQMVWEQGSVVIIMLSKLSENGYQLVHRYWPEEGSETYNIYEVHLVSEHVWCKDYLVRSLYLKNTSTGETRTVTQFHFAAWPDTAIPESTKSLLEFRRKVNKSYRGRSCPIIVHCSDGVGRSGTYVLLDMVLNRMSKGSKEIDIAATLEHIRDQRSGMVQTKSQFEFCLTAVAEETHAILKCLAQ